MPLTAKNSDPTDIKENNKKGRWKSKVYSKQLVEYANQNIREDERNMFKTLFEEIVDSHRLESAEDIMMLDNAIFDFIRIKRLQTVLMKEGDFINITLRSGQVIKKPHEANYLLNAVETQFRNTMKEMMLTRREVTKKQIGLAPKDFAAFIKDGAVDAEYKEVDSGKDSKAHR